MSKEIASIEDSCCRSFIPRPHVVGGKDYSVCRHLSLVLVQKWSVLNKKWFALLHSYNYNHGTYINISLSEPSLNNS